MIEIAEQPTGTVARYLVVNETNLHVTDLHGLLQEQFDTDPQFSIHLVMPNGETSPVEINDVSEGEEGFEFEVLRSADGIRVEYLRYSEGSGEIAEDLVWVDAFTSDPT